MTQRLSSYVARHPGLSASAVAARLVDEGLRMDEHPGIVFRDGAVGRRAGLVAGPDVWEVVRAVRSGRAAEPTLDESALLAMVEESTGVPVSVTRTAVDYWAAYPDEVEALIAHADEAEERALSQQDRIDGLLR